VKSATEPKEMTAPELTYAENKNRRRSFYVQVGEKEIELTCNSVVSQI